METATPAVILLAHTPEPERLVAAAARVCMSDAGAADLAAKMGARRVRELLASLAESGHDSPLEHASFSFAVEGVSRALSHQLVRHRIASYTQQSQRYTDGRNFVPVVPPSIAADPEALACYRDAIAAAKRAYAELSARVPREDARFVLPNAAPTRLVVTMNARALKNFFRLRCCERAQWEIRSLARLMLDRCRDCAPLLFAGMGASCEADGRCPEGPRSCGRPRRPARAAVAAG